MSKAHILGFPRIGAQRELKRALESYWQGDIGETDLRSVAQQIRLQNWQWQQNAGLDFVSVGDFSFYDHVLDTACLFSVTPKRFAADQGNELQRYFNMARGSALCGHQHRELQTACEMTKWFDTNYHYIVPEFEQDQCFSLNAAKLLEEIELAQQMNFNVKPVVLGPMSFLFLGKMTNSVDQSRLGLLDRLIPAYKTLLLEIENLGVEWLQIDEPILGLDLPLIWQQAFESAYTRLQMGQLKILLATYFSCLESNLATAISLPVAGLHVDAVEALSELSVIVDRLPAYKVLSVGIVNGRNVWRNEYEKSLQVLEPLKARLQDRLWVCASSSLLHTPVDLDNELALENDVRQSFAFAKQKLQEISILNQALNEGRASVRAALDENKKIYWQRSVCDQVGSERVKKALARISNADYQRSGDYSVRRKKQRALGLPRLPTTTIGSFPQTAEIRTARSQYRKGVLSKDAYDEFIKKEIKSMLEQQEALGLDVLVHGEPERNDMVEYFGEHLKGFVVCQNAWVQSYGSRCVKPPIIYGDVYREKAITVKWAQYAQSLSVKPVKAMLTGPATILKWSFVREDLSRETSCKQIALAIREEVNELEQVGIKIIQIDEAALREGMPLRATQQKAYVKWSVDSFRLASSGVRDATQIHSHMCYSEFNDFIGPIIDMNADVITIETARSDMVLLDAFKTKVYPNDIGPGVYDIHSPRIPSVEEIKQRLKKALQVFPIERLWVNPDCGLKTRAWPEASMALKNMVLAASELREEIA